MNSELCIQLYMICKKYGVYVEEKQTIINIYYYTILDLIITTVITTITKLQSIHYTHPNKYTVIPQ